MSDIITVKLVDCHHRQDARERDPELVEEIAASMRLRGWHPLRPLELMADGDIYWIVDGGHRRDAGLLAGLKEAPAVIEDFDEGEVLLDEAVLNKQRPDTREEKWGRLQRMLPLGVAPEAVEVATGVPAEFLPAVRRIAAKVNDPVAFADISLDQALAMQEFEDDAEAFGALRDAGERWRSVVSDIKRVRKLDEEEAFARRWLANAGVELIEGGGRIIKVLRVNQLGLPEGTTGARIHRSNNFVEVWFYGESPAGETPEEAAEREAKALHTAELSAAHDRILNFIGEKVGGLSRFDGAKLKTLAQTAWEEGVGAESAYLEVTALTDIEGGYDRMLASVLVVLALSAANTLRHGKGHDFEVADTSATLALYDALKAEGYEPSEVEVEALKELEGGEDDV